MSAQRQPIFLLADSQPLFGSKVIPALQECLKVTQRNITKAAYIGASNGDAPEYFELFVAALDHINLHDARMIRAGFGSDDRKFLERADLVLLAGGDADAGLDIIRGTGMEAIIADRYHYGAVLVGVSAGAMHLGAGWSGKEGLKLVPYYIGAHSDKNDWLQLRALLEACDDEQATGYGIPAGGALIYHADQSLEAVRQPVAEFRRSVGEEGTLRQSLLLPVT